MPLPAFIFSATTFLPFGLSLCMYVSVCLTILTLLAVSRLCHGLGLGLSCPFVCIGLSSLSPCSLMTRVGARLSFFCCSFGSMCACMCVSVCLCACIYEAGARGCVCVHVLGAWGCVAHCQYCQCGSRPYSVCTRERMWLFLAPIFLLQCRVDIA